MIHLLQTGLLTWDINIVLVGRIRRPSSRLIIGLSHEYPLRGNTIIYDILHRAAPVVRSHTAYGHIFRSYQHGLAPIGGGRGNHRRLKRAQGIHLEPISGGKVKRGRPAAENVLSFSHLRPVFARCPDFASSPQHNQGRLQPFKTLLPGFSFL